MKILITSDWYERVAVNGVVVSIRNLEEELKNMGHEVRILSLSADSKNRKEGNVYLLASAPFEVYPKVRIPIPRRSGYIKELIDWKPDVIHSQCEFFTYSYALYIQKATGASIVHTYHTLYEYYTSYIPLGRIFGKRALKFWLKRRLKNVDKIIAPTEKVAENVRHYGIEGDIKVIPTGIDLSMFLQDVSDEEIAEIKDRYGILPYERVMVSIGRLGVEKNVEELIDGMALLKDRFRDLKLLLVGDGPNKDSLVRKVEDMGLSDRVIFTGMVLPSEVYKFYRLGDLFVCASTSETQGLTYIESIASGLPMVCREDECLLGVIDEGCNGYTYRNLEEFVDMVTTVIEDEKWRADAGRMSKKLSKKYGTREFAEGVEEVYAEVKEA